jgi:large subunit ribosomal protein L24e
VYPGHGISFVRNDCKIFRFCRSKCHRAFKKKRNARKVRWTKAFRKSHGKEMTIVCELVLCTGSHAAQDPVLDFEKRRNVPTKYDRDLWQTTGRLMSFCSGLWLM